MEFAVNGTLGQVLEIERNDRSIPGWNDTKKLINIYGIASGMANLHSKNIIHRCLKPSNIYLDDALFPKIGDFGLSARFYNADLMTHQSISGTKATPIYSAPEILQYNEFSKMSDVYAFAFVVYEILMKEVPFTEITNSNQIFNEVVLKNKRPTIKKEIPASFRYLIEECWAQDPNERPKFDEIVYNLKNNPEFITPKIKQEDYLKYIDIIDFKTNQKNEELITDKDIKINECDSKQLNLDEKITETDFLEENENDKDLMNIQEENENDKDLMNIQEENENDKDLMNIQEENENDKDLMKIHEENSMTKNDDNESLLINEYISSNKAKKLMEYLNDNCEKEYISFIFDQCWRQSKDFYVNLCKEGILINNAIAHHKYAASLIFDSNEYDDAKYHLEESIKQGFTLSYFLYARLCYSIFNDSNAAFVSAQEGANRNEKYSKCLLGYFIAHGIGTKKDFEKGVEIMLNSDAEDYYEKFATDYGFYFFTIKKEEDKAFYWFEKAYNMKKTKVTINNYGICLMKGIGTVKNIGKAEEVFVNGMNQKDKNSMYHLAFIREKTNLEESLKLYRKAAKQGHINAQIKYASIISKTNPNENLTFVEHASNNEKILYDIDNELVVKYLKKSAEQGNIQAQEFLAKKYSKENDIENTYKYMHSLIKSGNYSVPFEYALNCYKEKQFCLAYKYFSVISSFNHPIAKYFVGLMKYKGQGCIQNHQESFEIMKHLSNHGIDKATEFIANNFK